MTGGWRLRPPGCAREGSALAYLITGIGYIGAKLAEDLLAAGHEVVGVDNFFASERSVVRRLCRQRGFRFVAGSVNSPATLKRAFALAPIEVVFALGAQASAHPDAASLRYTETTNLLSPRLLLDAALAHGARRVVYGSSMRVYGARPLAECTEDAAYGRFSDLSHLSKVYVEKLLEMYAYERGLPAVAARLGLVYGVGPLMKTDYRFLTAPNKFCLQAVRGETIQVSAGGMLPQGIVHVADAAHGLWLLAGLPDLPVYCAANLATEAASMLDVARSVADAAARRGLRARILAPEAESAPGPALPPSLLWERCYSATRSLAEAVDETLAYYAACEGARA